MSRVLALAIVATLFGMIGCSRERACADIQKKARRIDISTQLESWVDQKSQRKALIKKNAISGKFFMPGEYSLAVDGTLAGSLGPDYEARVILDLQNDIESVFIGRGNFQGFLVTLPRKKNSIVPDGILVPISDRSSLVCSERD